MKLSTRILTAFNLLTLILVAFSAFSTVTALPTSKGTSGANYRDIMFYQQGTLRLRATNGGPDILIPDTYFCDAKRDKGGCMGRNIINPTEAGLHAADPNLNIRYDGDLASLAMNNLKNHPAIFEKVNDDQAKDVFRYLSPGTKPWDRKKWEKENLNEPACNLVITCSG